MHYLKLWMIVYIWWYEKIHMINGGKKSHRTHVTVVWFEENIYVIHPIIISMKKKFGDKSKY